MERVTWLAWVWFGAYELSVGSISLIELGVFDENEVSNISADITKGELKELVLRGIRYCINYLDGALEEALNCRRKRNTERLIDPLWLDTKLKEMYKIDPIKYAQVKDSLSERNDELREIIKNTSNK